MSFTRVLVANRGEIACRVQRTAQRLGWRTVAVYSEADAGAPHVQMADQAVCIGPGPARDSYLNIPALLEAARRTQADAVHPGYGFLSENAAFAQACEAAGLVFIGPPAAAIAAMGHKAQAKRLMQAAGVPTIPGFDGLDTGAQAGVPAGSDADAPTRSTDTAEASDAAFVRAAEQLGYPLLVKAVAGGGGRGMRRVHHADELPSALASARREAESAFGDGRLMLERLITGGRHIEVQIFADSHGQTVHLGERDCSSQRRRQKLVEESPSPIVTPALREALGQAAVNAARAVGYVGAGTVEFIVDQQLRPYFLEMNTRLQVEHPVTEAVTGLDLVEWQLRVAAGEPLPLQQHQIHASGHAIEARLITEDPYAGWTPQTGTVLAWRPQDASIRVDHGLQPGQTVSPFYDGMVAKYVAHGRDRAEALRQLRRALIDAPLFGLAHNGGFLVDWLADPAFVGAHVTTTLLDEWGEQGHPRLQRPETPELAWRLAAAWRSAQLHRRPASVQALHLRLRAGQATRTLRVPDPGIERLSLAEGWLRACVDGVDGRWPAVAEGARLHLSLEGHVRVLEEAADAPEATTAHDARLARSPVTGVVAQVLVSVGQTVAADQPLACVEAMKMELWVKASAPSRVTLVRAAVGDAVSAGAVLIELEPEGPPHD